MQDLLKNVIEILLPALEQIIILVVGAFLTWLLNSIREFFVNKIGEQRQQQIESIVWDVVHAVDQVAPSLGIVKEQKYEQAVEWVTNALARRGIVITPDELKIFIEAVVRQIDPKE